MARRGTKPEGEKRREKSGQQVEALGGNRVRFGTADSSSIGFRSVIGLFQAGYTNRHRFHVQPRLVIAVHTFGHGRHTFGHGRLKDYSVLRWITTWDLHLARQSNPTAPPPIHPGFSSGV
jgi:hypothetical protein